MSELRSVLLAIELATRQRDDLAKAAAKARRDVGFAQDQMGQLQGYAGDTDARWTGSASTGLSTELMRHHYQFMGRLQQAIAMQKDVMENTNRQLALAEKALLSAEFRLSGLNRVLETRQAARLLTQRRREQRQTDEFASMLHARSTTNPLRGDAP
jgi:flagellar FliJ protein